MAYVTILPVISPGVIIHQLLHDLPYWLLLCRQFQVKMICHQAECMQDKGTSALDLPQDPQEQGIVLLTSEYRASSVSPAHDVVAGAFIPYPLFPCHK